MTFVRAVGHLGRGRGTDRQNLFLTGLKSVILHAAQAAGASIMQDKAPFFELME